MPNREDMLALCKQNQQQSCRKIGQIGLGQEMSRAIPLKVVQDDCSVCKDRMTIFNKWQAHFQRLVNADSAPNIVLEAELPK